MPDANSLFSCLFFLADFRRIIRAQINNQTVIVNNVLDIPLYHLNALSKS